MQLFNSLGKRFETFRPPKNKTIKIFTCGPSIYLRPHIGNYRTFLYEDVLVRYLEYKQYKVQRAMNFTDIEDKTISEAIKSGISVFEQTKPSQDQFFKDMKLLHMKTPIIALATDIVKESIEIIEILLKKGLAYNFKDSIYFDPLRFPEFGKLYGLDKSRWPKKKIRYKKDTYPGNRWNLGDFILWHKADKSSVQTDGVWESPWGYGRPSWNIQDSAVIYKCLDSPIHINCGGIDNIIRHHDYNIAIMESAFNRPLAQFYLHGAHLFVEGKKMSKSLGNIYYPEDIINSHFQSEDLRLFLIGYKHYRQKLNFTQKNLEKVYRFRHKLRHQIEHLLITADQSVRSTHIARRIQETFESHMDDDLGVKNALHAIDEILYKQSLISQQDKREFISILGRIDSVLQIQLLKHPVTLG